jgi:SAM-dependent methyltransferase
MNCELSRRVKLSGHVLDLGAGDRPSYWRFVDKPPRLTTLDIDRLSRPEIVASLEASLPLLSACVDSVIALNVFEHVYGGAPLAREIHRVLRPGGRLFCSVPFLVPIHADPYDFLRYTGWALHRLLDEAGFASVQVVAYGGYFAALTEHVNRFNRISVLRAATVILSTMFDGVLNRVVGRDRNAGRFVLGYYAEGTKPDRAR